MNTDQRPCGWDARLFKRTCQLVLVGLVCPPSSSLIAFSIDGLLGQGTMAECSEYLCELIVAPEGIRALSVP